VFARGEIATEVALSRWDPGISFITDTRIPASSRIFKISGKSEGSIRIAGLKFPAVSATLADVI
jgi:hypothetical protein